MTLQAQLVLSLASLPILVHWGLPISMMTIIGNVIFSPFLMAFVFLSSLLFFTELCSIPNLWIAYGLNNITEWWSYLLSFGRPEWLCSFVHPGNIFLAVMGAGIIVILTFGTYLHIKIRLLLLSAALLSATGSLLIYEHYFYTKPHLQHRKFTVSIHKKYGISVYDNGYFASKKSPDKAVYFELRPYLIKTYGTLKINRIVTNRVGLRTFQGLLHFCQLFRVQKVVLPFFKKKLSKKAWYFFFTLKRYLAEHSITFIRPSQRSIKYRATQKKNHS